MTRPTSLLWSVHATKIWTALAVTSLAGIIWIGSLWVPGETASVVGNVAALAVLVTLFCLGRSATCPACNLRVIFHGMRSQRVGSWLHWALEAQECPRCGYTVDGGMVSSNNRWSGP